MQNGPSIEELQNYWNNSRQYFDELANYYRQSDIEYYNQYIAPFYNNPFHTSARKNNTAAPRIIFAFAIMLLIAGIGVGAFFFTYNSKQKTPQWEKEVTRPYKKDSAVTSLGDSLAVITESSDYKTGLTYFHAKDYDNAEKYFKMVPKTDRNYRSAQKYIKEIEIISGIKEVEPVPTPHNDRKEPIKRIR